MKTWICEIKGRYTSTVLLEANNRKEALIKLKAGDFNEDEVDMTEAHRTGFKVCGLDKVEK